MHLIMMALRVSKNNVSLSRFRRTFVRLRQSHFIMGYLNLRFEGGQKPPSFMLLGDQKSK